MVHIDPTGTSFHLHNSHFSYGMTLVDHRFLAHLYWGPPLSYFDPSTLLHLGSASYLAATPLRGGANVGGATALSLELLRQEYPTWGTGDQRDGAFRAVLSDGTEAVRLEYLEHELIENSFQPEGMELLREDHTLGATETLRIRLGDPRGDLAVDLFYLIQQKSPALYRWARFSNLGPNAATLIDPASACVDLPAGSYEMVTLGGAWARERHVVRSEATAGQHSVSSRRGASSHQTSPFISLCDPGATEQSGTVFAMALGYSGSFQAVCDVDQYDTPRISIGVNRLRAHLEPGESFDTPPALLVHSDSGFGGMSNRFYTLLRRGVIPRKWREQQRQVVINSWEALYFQVDAKRTVELAKGGRKVGAELVVLDDGWFSGRRDDTSSLGDWWPNEERFPGGLGPVAKAVRNEGLDFGLWIEPEMVSPHSVLYREHPEWALQIDGREKTLARNQLILDLSNPQVEEYLFGVISDLLTESTATYVKWDMNRTMTEAGSPAHPPERQGEVMHRYILGLYRLLDRLTREFPQVLFEGCAGGGGRFDVGLLRFSPRFWASDQTDALERLEIQYGTTLVFPPETIGAHVSSVPNHQVGRITPAETRVLTALPFSFGFELDPAAETEKEIELFRHGAQRFRELRQKFAEASFYRLLGPLTAAGRPPLAGGFGGETAWMLVTPKQNELFVFYYRPLNRPNRTATGLRLYGLTPGTVYEDAERSTRYDAIQLMHIGLTLDAGGGDHYARFWHLRRWERKQS